jgi:uncharacterized repeat protein (TIGR03803 family)
LWIASCLPAFAGITFEQLTDFQPAAYTYNTLTRGSDGYVYTISNDGANRRRIIRIDAQGRIETVLIFALESHFTSVEPWLVLGSDGLLYGCASRSSLPAPENVIYRLTDSGAIEEIGDGYFNYPPVLGGDGALYGIKSDRAGLCRFRPDGVFEIVPGTETLRNAGFAPLNPVSTNGAVYFTTSAALWKIGPDGILAQLARFDSESPTVASLGSNLGSDLVRGKSGVVYGRSRAGGPENRGVLFKVLASDVLEPMAAFGTAQNRIDGTLSQLSLAEGFKGPYIVTTTSSPASRKVYAVISPWEAAPVGTLPLTNSQIRLITGKDNEAYAVHTVGEPMAKRTFFKLSLYTGCTVVAESPDPIPSGEQVYRDPIIGPDGGIWAISSPDQGLSRFSVLVRLAPLGTFDERLLVPGKPLPSRDPTDLRALADGSLVGIGDVANSSSIFRVYPDGRTSFLTNVPDARFAPVLFDDGSLVGASVESSGAHGYLYRLRPDGRQDRVVFEDQLNPIPGAHPDGLVIPGGDGSWYGLTRYGGDENAGTIYKVSPSFQVESVHQFGHSTDIKRPLKPTGSFLKAEDGALYAVAVAGGRFGFGGLIQFKPGVGVSLVTSFPEPIASQSLFPTSSPPIELTLGKDGWFYGVTSYHPPTATNQTTIGKGFVFRVSRNGKFQVLGRFTGKGGSLPGRKPVSALTINSDGFLFGVTEFGGEADFGTVFRVKPGGPVQHLASFTGETGRLPGSNPLASLVVRGSTLIGACTKGGVFDAGTLFVVRNKSRVALLQTFTNAEGPTPGCAPNRLAVGTDGNVYGTSGSNGVTPSLISPEAIHGSVFRLNITASTAPVDDRMELPITRVDLLANDGFDLTTQSTTISAITQPGHGTATLHHDGTVTYRPNATFTGTDTFTYTVRDGENVLGTATVTVVDTRPPEFTSLPLQLSVAISDGATALLPNLAGKTRVKDASGFATVTQSPLAGTALGPGQHQVTLTATDNSGNSSTRVETVYTYDSAPPLITQGPADRTIIRPTGDPQPPCPDFTPEVSATDNVGVVSVLQSPPAGAALPDGYTHITITVSDGSNYVVHKSNVRVVPASDVAGMTGDIVPGFDEQHRYVSFGSPALGADGTLAYTAQIKADSGRIKTALFRRLPGANPTPIAVTGAIEGFTTFGPPLVAQDGTVIFKATAKAPDGARFVGIWSAELGKPTELITAQWGLFFFREFKDISVLDSGALLIHATFVHPSTQSVEHMLWFVANESWKLLLQTGESLTIDGNASTLHSFNYGKLPPRLGAQTRSFNSSGQLALRLTLADNRVFIARLSLSGDEVILEPVAKVGSANIDWLGLGIPAIGDNGDIAFRGTLQVGDKNVQAIGRVAADQNVAKVIASDSVSQGSTNLGDPIVTPDGRVVFAQRRHTPFPRTTLVTWEKNNTTGGTVTPLPAELSNRTTTDVIRHIDRFAVSAAGIFSLPRFNHSATSPLRRGIVFTESFNALLQAEGDTPIAAPETTDRIVHLDFLTPLPGVGGQTRAINASGQAAFRAKLSSGRSAIYVINP